MAKKALRLPKQPKGVRTPKTRKRPVRLAQVARSSQERLRSIFGRAAGPSSGQRRGAPRTAADERNLLDRAARGDKAAIRERKKLLGF